MAIVNSTFITIYGHVYFVWVIALFHRPVTFCRNFYGFVSGAVYFYSMNITVDEKIVPSFLRTRRQYNIFLIQSKYRVK